MQNLFLFSNLRLLIVGMVVSFLSIDVVNATHIRAGEITAKRTGPLSYCFTIFLYTDDTPGTADSPDLDLNFGDGSPVVIVPRKNPNGRIQLANETKLNIYEVCHTFPAVGPYVVFFIEQNRNADVRNMSNSVFTPFSVSTLIVIDPNLGLNSTPTFRVAPLDVACVGQKFFHNPGAFDEEGDSLSFKFTTPRQSSTQNVGGYQDPNAIGNGQNEDLNGPPTFKLDPITGDLTWDAPAVPGEYNIAFLVEEWRNGVRIGFVVRDMQILVFDCPNKRPRLNVPDICVVADEDPSTNSNMINQVITATDPDLNPKDEIIISSKAETGLQQGVYDPAIFDVVADFTFTKPQFSPASGIFTWDTRCEHVRKEPYIVVFKAEDQPITPRGPKLVDVQSMLITVKGPPPLNLTATPDAKTMNLTWQNYKLRCPDFTDAQYNNMEIIVWRREGCLATIPCDKNPDEMGYIQIGKTNLNATSFKDNGPLRPGLSYSYVITVSFPLPQGGTSQASQEVCVFIPIDSPLITKSSINITNAPSATNGQVTVNWLRPRPSEGDISATFAPPYRFELFRATGFNGTNFVKINEQTDIAGNQIQYAFVDNNLNTNDQVYLYKVEWFTNAGTVLEGRRIPSDSASTVRLTATPANNSIILTWDYNVPWSNQNQIHQIFRGLEGEDKSAFIKVGEVLVGQRRFVDDGSVGGCLDPKKVYCYYVTTKGSYSNPTIPEPAEGLLNDSQIDCASPLDNTPPPPPVLALAPLDCENFDETTPIQNNLSWTLQTNGNPCESDISTYKLHYTSVEGGDFTLISNPPFVLPFLGTTFVHQAPFLPVINGFTSQAGCYYVTAVDASGNESAPSNIVCQDNCAFYELPNVFTPNGDGVNDLLRPMPEPRFVSSVKFTIFNRWGGKIIKITDDIFLNWDGKNEQGKEVPSGIYYYVAEVTFINLRGSNTPTELKGWIKITRDLDN